MCSCPSGKLPAGRKPGCVKEGTEALHSMVPSRISTEERDKKNLCPRTKSWSLPSGTVGEWFLGMRCRQERQSTPTHTSGRWKNSGSFSNHFGLPRIQHISCIIQWRREGRMKLEKITGAQICCIFFTFVRFAFAGRTGGAKFFLSPETEPFLGGSGFSIMLGSTHVWRIQLNSVSPSTLQPWSSTLRFPPSLSGTKFETYDHVIRAVRTDHVSLTRHGNDKVYMQLFPVGPRP